MKKLLIAGNIILASVVIYLGLKTYNGPKKEKNCANVFCRDYSTAQWNGIISANVARVLSDNYVSDTGKKYVWFGQRADNTMLDATSIWFNLDSLKKFFWEIETQYCKYGCNDKLGVRFYYAKYPDSVRMRQLGIGEMARFQNRHTLFAVPTYWDPNQHRHIDFNPYAGCRGGFYPRPTGDTTRNLFFLPMGSGGSPDVQNHGGLVPPPDGEGRFSGF